MDSLRQQLIQLFPDLNLHLFDSLPSTSRYLASIKHDLQYPALCYTAKQTQGQGTFNKHWYAPESNLTFTLAVDLQQPLSDLSAFSVLVGLFIIQVLESLNIKQSFKLKWPNDLFDEHGKVGGILIEVLEHDDFSTKLSIGVGLNFSAPMLNNVLPYEASFINYDQPQIVLQRTLKALYGLAQRESFVLSPDELQYAQFCDYFRLGEKITLVDRLEENHLEAVYHGIQTDGVCLVSQSGQLKSISSSQVSLRKK